MLQATEPKSEGQSVKRATHRGLRHAVTAVLVLALAGYLLLRWMTASVPERCTVDLGDVRVGIDFEQAANAATIAAVAASRGLPERAVTIALATAMQESALRNLRHGDRDSLGLFQQRPSKGWGTEREVLDPVHAAHAFYEALEDVPGYIGLPLTVAAQKVQRSGFPDAYAKHEDEATVLAAALSGREPRTMNCTLSRDARREVVAAPFLADLLRREFGRAAGSVQQDGRTVLVRPAGGERSVRHAAAIAAWAVTHSKELNLERIVHGNTTWTAGKSDDGWQHNAAGDSESLAIAVNN